MTAFKPRLMTAEPKAPPSLTLGIGRYDVFLLGLLPTLALIAWLVPEPRWRPVCVRLARLQQVVRRRRHASSHGQLAASLAQMASPFTPEQLLTACAANSQYERLLLLRCYRPFANRPRKRLQGAEHIENALKEGRGAVLWVAPFAFGSLMTKMALHGAGYRATHLSTTGHGFSRSPFGRRMLNPIRTQIEGRYLAERVLVSRDDSVAPLRKLSRRLRRNELVSITSVSSVSRQLSAVPFLGGSLPMARGAPGLAWQTGARLLPVFAIREPGGEFVTVVEPPVSVPVCANRDEAVEEMLLRFAAILESYVMRWPDQFARWLDVGRFDGEDAR